MIAVGIFALPLELAGMALFFETPWGLFLLDWCFAEIFTFAAAFALGGFIRGLRIGTPMAFAALGFGGLLCYSLGRAFLGPLRSGYGEVPNLYWLFLIIPMLTALAEKMHMFIFEVNLGESVLMEKGQGIFVAWILLSVFGPIAYVMVCT